MIATVSSEEKAAFARRAGADHVVNYRTEEHKLRIAELTAGTGVDRIIEVDLKANAMTYPDVLAEHGKAVIYGSGAPPIAIPSFIPYSTTLQFILVYTLSDYQRESHVAALDRLLTAGKLQHSLGEHFSLERIADAHERVEAGSLGNVIVDVSS